MAAVHATDVLQTVHYMLLEGDASKYLRQPARAARGSAPPSPQSARLVRMRAIVRLLQIHFLCLGLHFEFSFKLAWCCYGFRKVWTYLA